MVVLLRLVLTSIAIYLAARVVPGVQLAPGWTVWHLLLVGLVFGLLNAFVKPILVFFSLPVLLVTLGLFYLVINALILWITSLFFSVLIVKGFWPAVLGGLVITLFNWAVSLILERR